MLRQYRADRALYLLYVLLHQRCRMCTVHGVWSYAHLPAGVRGSQAGLPFSLALGDVTWLSRVQIVQLEARCGICFQAFADTPCSSD